LSAYAALSAGMAVWVVARFGFGAETPYLLALAAASAAYVGAAVFDRARGHDTASWP
jgi:hypothetical protein